MEGEPLIESLLNGGPVSVQDQRGEDALPDETGEGSGVGGVVRRLVGGVDVEGRDAQGELAGVGVAEAHDWLLADPIGDHLQLSGRDQLDGM